jgi:uncharacterized protein (DUF1786 family)
VDGGPDGWRRLSDAANTFWQLIAGELRPTGKIILVGCYMGGGEYAADVAAATKRTVYAADGLSAAANVEATVRHVRAIERGAVLLPMKRFKP